MVDWREFVQWDTAQVQIRLSGNQVRLIINALDVYDAGEWTPGAEAIFLLLKRELMEAEKNV